ncbi:MAG: arginine deiminase family protein [Candidatus Bathyarchaeia archaeon]
MWTVNSESGVLHAVLIQDSIEQFWERRLPFVGIESSHYYLARCPHASFREGREGWNRLQQYLGEEGVHIFELVSILKKILEGATLKERMEIIKKVWNGRPIRPEAEELSVEHLTMGYPPKPYFDPGKDRVVLPDFTRVAWPYPRDTSFTSPVGTVICAMRRYSRIFEPSIVRLAYEYDGVLSRNIEIIWDANASREKYTEPLCIEGGDTHIIDRETIVIGIGQRSTFTGFIETAKKLFENDSDQELRYICAVNNPDYPAVDYMHLDVVINYPDKGKALVMPYYFESEVIENIPKKRLLLKTLEAVRAQSEEDDRPMEPLVHPNDFKEAGRCSIYTRDGDKPKLLRRETSLLDFLLKEGKLEKDGIIFVGGEPETENDVEHLLKALMEQARGASNIFTIKPGVVIAYGRNRLTNEALREHGIRVKEWDDRYLDMLGGPHCSMNPLSRDEC